MNNEEWRRMRKEYFWSNVEDALFLLTAFVVILSLIALVTIQLMEWLF